MTVYIYVVTQDGKYVDAFLNESDAQDLKYKMYRGGCDSPIYVNRKVLK